MARLGAVLDRDENAARGREAVARAELRLRKGEVEIAVDPHDFARRFHFGRQHRVGAGEAREGENRFLHRDMRDVAVDLRQVGELFARSEEQTFELQSQMRISYAVFCLKKKQKEKV